MPLLLLLKLVPFPIAEHMIQTHRQLAKALYALMRNKPVPTVCFTTQNCFYKIPIGAMRRKRLHRELRIAKTASLSNLYANRAVLSYRRFGALACSVKHQTSLDYDWILDRMLELWQEQLSQVQHCSYKPATTIIETYFNQLRTDGMIEGESVGKSELNDESLKSLQLPMSHMHGDLAPSNIVSSGNKMLFIDWEWGNEMGTVLYDWWYFLGYLQWIKNNRQSVPDFRKLDKFIKVAFRELDVDCLEFEKFGRLILSFKTQALNS